MKENLTTLRNQIIQRNKQEDKYIVNLSGLNPALTSSSLEPSKRLSFGFAAVWPKQASSTSRTFKTIMLIKKAMLCLATHSMVGNENRRTA